MRTGTEPIKSLSAARSPSTRFEAYMQACREIQWDRPDEAVVFARLARKAARSMKDASKELHALRMVGICQYAAHDFEGAAATFSDALTRYRKRKDASGTARALQNLGLSYRGLGRNEEALVLYRESEGILREIDDEEILSKVLNNIGTLCMALNHSGQALEAFSECLVIAERRGDAHVVARLMGNIADVYAFVGDVDISLDWSRRAVEQHRKNEDMLGVGITLATLGRVLRSKNDVSGALAVMTESLTVMTSLKDDVGIARSLYALSELYLEIHQYVQAATFARDALEVFRLSNDVDRTLRCLIVLARIAHLRKDRAGAQDHIKEARKAARLTDNHPLHADLEVISAEVAQRDGDVNLAVRHLKAALRITEKANIPSLRADIAASLASIYEKRKEFKAALDYEKMRAQAQRAAEEHLRARHGQALQLRLDMERARRARESAQHTSERLTFELASKERELNASAISIAQKNELLTTIADDLRATINVQPGARGPLLRSLLVRIEGHRNNGEDWRHFTEKLKDVHDGFFKLLGEKYPDLTPTELKLASLLKLDLPSKEIADILSINLPTVEVYRSRLRKKLQIPSATSLSVFFRSLGA